MRVADYIFKTLADRGVRDVFVVVGGGAMFLDEALGQEHRLRYICNHHEQACTMGAEGHARITGKVGVACVTTGPGGINALNGVFGAWTDSIPMLVVSGQVKRETFVGSYDLPDLRQLGDQEVDIVRLARPITKYAVTVTDPATIRYHLEKALFLAAAGRPGPCWIDVPVDVQSASIDPDQLAPYDPAPDTPAWDGQILQDLCRQIIDRLRQASRPAIMIGTGVRLAGSLDLFHAVIAKLGIPVTTAWTTHDSMDSADPLYCGRPGSLGDRPGNFTVQNADVLLVIGCRLNIRQVGYEWNRFAPHAFKIQVDIDPAELHKPTVKPDLAVCCDAKVFLERLQDQLDGWQAGRHDDWLRWCRQRVQRYPVVLPKHRLAKPGVVNPYHFVDVLFDRLRADDVVVCGNGSACVIPYQAGAIKRGQRLFCNSGNASMGYDLPAAIGAAVARGSQRVICLAGDGSLQMNIQELQTVIYHQLPIKLFVLNNNGYVSIRMTQNSFFQGHFVGCGPESGVSFPDIMRLGQAYGFTCRRIDRQDCAASIQEVLDLPGPVLCEVMLDPEQFFEPKLSSKTLPGGKIVSGRLEDLAPFLDPDEQKDNVLPPLANPPETSKS